MNRWSIAALAAILVAVSIGTYQYFGSGGQSQTDKVVVAQVADFFLYAPLYVAKDDGLFAKNHLDVSITSAGGDEKAWAAVISGAAQFGVGDPTFVAIADQQGQPGRVIASIVNGVPFWGITLRKDILAISRPSDLGQFSVATFPSPSTAFTLQQDMYRRGRLTPNIRQGAFGALIPMLSAGQADIALELEPNVSTAVVKQHARVLYSLADIYGDFAITGLTATPRYLKDNPDVARRMVCSLREAIDVIQNDPNTALKILLRRFPEVDPKAAAAALERVRSKRVIPRDVQITSEAWMKALALRVSAGDVHSPKAMASYVDNSFAILADRDCGAKR